MNRIWEDLRLDFSQARAAWTLFGGAVGMYVLLVLLEALGLLGGRYGAFSLSSWWAHALFLGGIPAGGGNRHEALAAPLSFTLPGYRESLRRSSFVRAVRWGVIVTLILFSHTWDHLLMWADWPRDLPKPASAVVDVPGVLLAMVGGLFVGMTLCLAWVNSALVGSRRRWFGALVVGLAVFLYLGASRAAIMHHMVLCTAVIPPSVFFCGFFWRRLGNMEWVKDGHREVLVRKTGGSWGIEVRTTVVSCKTGAGREPDARTAASRREDLLLGAMHKDNSTAAAPHVWGWLYRAFGPAFSQWKWIVVSLLASILILGYVNGVYAGIAFVFLGVHVAGGVWTGSTTILLPEGRREKYYLTIVSGALASLLLIAVSAGVIGLSWLLAALIPPISLGTYHLQYTGLGLKNVWLACLPVPWFPVVMLVMAMIVLSLRLVVPFLILLAVLFLVPGRIPDVHPGPNLLPILLICGWVFFLLIVWIKYRQWDLADE